MSESMIERVKQAIAEKYAPAIDHNAPYAKVMLDMAARAAIEATREPLLAIIAKEEQGFLSPEYATGQPLSSLQERFACKEVAKAIAAALSSEDEGK